MSSGSKNQGVGVAVLAGGASTRMGTNKALLRQHPNGPTMIETVVARLSEAGLAPHLLVTNSPQDFAFLNIPIVTDDIPGAGSLGGIYTALNHLLYERTLTVACDMPLLNPSLLRYMAFLPTEADVLVPRWTDAEGNRHIETLHAIYSRRCIEPIRKRIEAGKLKVQALLEDVSVEYVDEAELRHYDPQLKSFRNINTPEEWERLRSKL
ncbi:MAG: molybdenum cofactor guanylyltransferase [Chloroflexota bacterium]|nr:molybdenum cofactor guanylyltransferase [Chloroflexota bacterium]MDQ5867095.1 molybdenum cofactor guanylyltransferase [Chloroflexota bacterium]